MRGSSVGKRAAIVAGLWALGQPGSARAQGDLKPTDAVADVRGGGALPAGAADEVVYKGRATAGSVVVVGTDGPIPVGTTFHWSQVEGPPVAIDDTRGTKIRFTVPADARRLTFLATIADDRGSRVTRITVPISAASPPSPTSPPSPISAPSPTSPMPTPGALPRTMLRRASARRRLVPGASGMLPMADAGDDQIGLAGRRITLSGVRSKPTDQVGYRWMHLAGPAISEAKQEGSYYSFVPSAPGVYRFALLVGHRDQVSMPSVVAVEVGQRPMASGGPPAAEPSPLARWASNALVAIPGSGETAPQVADVFEAIAGRAPLYTSFSQLQSELTRRLDVVIPLDPSSRGLWSSQVFVPLSQITAAELMAAGIDLRVPMASDRPLESPQRERIGAFYRSLAVAFRSRTAKP